MDLQVEKLKLIDKIIHTYDSQVIERINKILEKVKPEKETTKVNFSDLRKKIRVKMSEEEIDAQLKLLKGEWQRDI